MAQNNFSVALVGFGNLGRSLYKACVDSGIKVDAVYNRTDISNLLDSDVVYLNTPDFTAFKSNFIFIVLPDQIALLLKDSIKLNSESALVHTSGTLDMEVLSTQKKYGVMYPVQTFSVNKETNWKGIPVFVEASTDDLGNQLMDFAKLLSEKVQYMDSQKRKHIHLAAVIACNFSNHMIYYAEEVLKDVQLDLPLLAPLLHETIEKAFALGPFKGQTGPAVRGDMKVISEHLSLLDNKTELRDMYRTITADIIHKHLN